MKYLGLILTKNLKDPCIEKYKVFLRKIKDNLINGKILCSWVETHNNIDKTLNNYVENM